ncbi:hypothetical protein GGI42DRAFT_87768 [Trichoderma sp. SZMC 28013]
MFLFIHVFLWYIATTSCHVTADKKTSVLLFSESIDLSDGQYARSKTLIRYLSVGEMRSANAEGAWHVLKRGGRFKGCIFNIYRRQNTIKHPSAGQTGGIMRVPRECTPCRCQKTETEMEETHCGALGLFKVVFLNST